MLLMLDTSRQCIFRTQTVFHHKLNIYSICPLIGLAIQEMRMPVSSFSKSRIADIWIGFQLLRSIRQIISWSLPTLQINLH